MYSPKELEDEEEQEVDHTFFDSDCEDEGRRDEHPVLARGEKKKENGSDVSMNRIRTNIRCGNGSDEKRQLKSEMNESGLASANGKQRISSILEKPSDNPSTTIKNTMSSKQLYSSEEEQEPEDFKPNKATCVSSDDYDAGYHQSDESEKDLREPAACSSEHQGPAHTSARKKNLVKSRKTMRCRSSSSESSLSSEESSSQKSAVKRQSRDTSESDGSVTDVTPLSTPNSSPAHSINCELSSEPSASVGPPQILTMSTESKEASDSQESISSEGEDEDGFLKVQTQLDRVLMVSSPSSVRSNRKNFSFTNMEVDRIDQENRRLMRVLTRMSSRSHNSSLSSSSGRRGCKTPIRLYHSALNRQREQDRIHKENLAFLKRLESVKPSPGITRDEQLADYQRQCRYLGRQVTTVPQPALKTKSAMTHGSCSQPCSSPHKARPETAKLSREKPRAAWS